MKKTNNDNKKVLNVNKNMLNDKKNIKTIDNKSTKSKNIEIADNNMVKKIEIEEVNINGEGISNINGIKYCVTDVLPKEVVEVLPVFSKNNFVKAKVNNVIECSSKRQKPFCPFYTKCGGCNLQILKYEDGINLKKQIIQNYFLPYYNKPINFVESNKEWQYRNKISFAVKNQKIGLQEKNSNNIVEINNCCIADENINKVLVVSKNWLREIKNTDINHIVVRILNKKVIITIVGTKKQTDKIKILYNNLNIVFGENNIGIYFNFNKVSSQIFSNNWEHLFGLKLLEDNAFNIKYFVHPYSFLQVNDEVRNKIYEKILNLVDKEVVIEGFSGAGLMTAILSKKAKKVFGVEINKQATKNANELKLFNNLSNITNINGDCKEELPKLLKIYPQATFLVDPPRSGCDNETLIALKKSMVQKVIYLSCNPYTLKQNIGFLQDSYKVESMECFDMFPQTTEVETLVVLKRK